MDADDCPFDGEVPSSRQPRQPIISQPVLQSAIENVISTPMKSLSFGAFTKLKSGFDKFSGMNLTELQEVISEDEWRYIVEAFEYDEKSQASCIRWMLRGLDGEKAVRKVKTDLTISENATKHRR